MQWQSSRGKCHTRFGTPANYHCGAHTSHSIPHMAALWHCLQRCSTLGTVRHPEPQRTIHVPCGHQLPWHVICPTREREASKGATVLEDSIAPTCPCLRCPAATRSECRLMNEIQTHAKTATCASFMNAGGPKTAQPKPKPLGFSARVRSGCGVKFRSPVHAHRKPTVLHTTISIKSQNREHLHNSIRNCCSSATDAIV